MKHRWFSTIVLSSTVALVLNIAMWAGSIRLNDLVLGDHWVGDTQRINGHYELDTDLPALFRYGWPMGKHGRFPYWLAAGLTALLPLWWARSHLWRRRQISRWQQRGCCLQCGYDLRAHRSGDCCPECGMGFTRPTVRHQVSLREADPGC